MPALCISYRIRNIITLMALKLFARLSQAFRIHNTAGTPAGSLDSSESEPSSSIGVGALLDGRFRLEAEIGRGGMGIVYRAHDIPNKRDVAVKIINFNEANVLTREQFEFEKQITAGLKYPNIVSVYETGTFDTGKGEPLTLIVMELVPGVGLDKMLNYSYARIIDFGQQICGALHNAHSHGVVHRDLKPGNVLVKKNGFQYTAKLADFSLARP